jgi:uncharacterized protein (DUF362 family)
MTAKVAIVEFDQNVRQALEQGINLIGKIDDLNTRERQVVIKVGVFDPKADVHSSVEVVSSIVSLFNKAPHIYLAESDNYRGTGSERLQIWKELFTKRVVPFNLSEDTETKKVKIGNEQMSLSHIIFKPNVLVSTHVLRSFEKGSILKNLFGLVPDRKKARFHKVLDTVLLDLYEAAGGIDLAVMDATHFYRGAGAMPHTANAADYRIRMNMLIVGRDAVAVETVGSTLAGLKPEKMPLLEEAKKRGLGETDLDKINIMGVSLEEAKARLSAALKKT